MVSFADFHCFKNFYAQNSQSKRATQIKNAPLPVGAAHLYPTLQQQWQPHPNKLLTIFVSLFILTINGWVHVNAARHKPPVFAALYLYI